MNPLVPLMLMAAAFAPAPEPRLPKRLPRVLGPTPDLQAALHGFVPECRAWSDEGLVGLEGLADRLVKRFPSRDDSARVWGTLAWAAGQSDVKRHAERVRKYARMCLALSRDPIQRGRMHSLLASAVPLDGHVFAEGRREAAALLLAGYAELLAQGLPEKAPEMPALAKGDTSEEVRAARAEAVFLREQVAVRDTLVMQLRDLFKPEPKQHGRNPEGPAELRRLARRWLKEREIDALLEKVTR